MAAFSVTEALVAHITSMGYETSTRAPADAPETFVTVERVGGGVQSYVDRASVAVQVWSSSDASAEEAASALRLSLLLQPPPAGVHSIRVESGPYPFYDEHTRKARYQMVLSVACQLETHRND